MRKGVDIRITDQSPDKTIFYVRACAHSLFYKFVVSSPHRRDTVSTASGVIPVCALEEQAPDGGRQFGIL